MISARIRAWVGVSLAGLLSACVGHVSPSADSPASVASAKKPKRGLESILPSPEKKKTEQVTQKDNSQERFVANLCAGKYPSVAIGMFAKDSQWQRAYVRVKEIDPFNTLGGKSSREKLIFDEEVLMLDAKKEANAGGMSLGARGYHVLRWDGSCATVMEDEITNEPPPQPGSARVVWNYLESDVQEALLQDTNVKKARRTQRSACGTSSSFSPTPACEAAHKKLSTAIVAAVRKGISLPASLATPESLAAR